MLHGYTQSGPSFRAKSRALEKQIQKAYPGSTLWYPTGPLKLRPSDVPGYDATSSTNAADQEVEAFGWWRRSSTADPPMYVGLEDGLAEVAGALNQEGPFDGVIGFSQGAALAAMMSSLLQGQVREDSFETLTSSTSSSSCASSLSLPSFPSSSAASFPFPASFRNLQHPPLKFCILYSGFIAPGERYSAFYQPFISTPSCHFLGSLDTIVEEKRCLTLYDAFVGSQPSPRLIRHPGGHFLPSSKQYLQAAVSFIGDAMQTNTSTTPVESKEEDARDMELPF